MVLSRVCIIPLHVFHTKYRLQLTVSHLYEITIEEVLITAIDIAGDCGGCFGGKLTKWRFPGCKLAINIGYSAGKFFLESLSHAILHSRAINFECIAKEIVKDVLVKILDNAAKFCGGKVADYIFPNFQIAKDIAEKIVTSILKICIRLLPLLVNTQDVDVKDIFKAVAEVWLPEAAIKVLDILWLQL